MYQTNEILKRDEARQLALVVLMEPDTLDTQGEFASAATIEKLAHQFAEDGLHRNVMVMHHGERIDATLVETYIAKEGDPNARPGTWLGLLKINDRTVWQKILSKEFGGVSVGGLGRTIAAKLNGIDAREIVEGIIKEISIVDKPANRRPVLMTKNDRGPDMDAILQELARAVDQIGAQQSALAKRIDAFGQTGNPQSLTKAEATLRAESDGKIRYHQNRIATLESSLEKVWAGETSGLSEADIRNEIAKSEIELSALGHVPERTSLDHNSAFFARGGSSTFLVDGGVGNLQTDMGVRGVITKSDEDSINVTNNLKL